MIQDIIEEYMVADGKPILVKKIVVKKEVPPDLTALKVLKQIYNELDLYNLDGEDLIKVIGTIFDEENLK